MHTNLNLSIDIVCVSMDDSKFSMDGCFLEVGLVSLCRIGWDFVLLCSIRISFFYENHGFFFRCRIRVSYFVLS